MVAGGEETEPMYGDTYLPRKFKVGFALPPVNDVDIFSQDLGFIAIEEKRPGSRGYNVTVGGGQGMAHGQTQTFPRLADVVGFIAADQVNAIGEAVLTTQRDFGDRTNRRPRAAQIHHRGSRHRVVQGRGSSDAAASRSHRRGPSILRPSKTRSAGTNARTERGFMGCTCSAGASRIEDGWPMKTALREIAEIHTGDFRNTPSQKPGPSAA